MTMDEICALVAADTTGMVGPAYRGNSTTGVVVIAVTAPGSYAEIMRSGEDGRTWTEHGVLYGTCAACHLERPTGSMKDVGGCWWCPDETPKD